MPIRRSQGSDVPIAALRLLLDDYRQLFGGFGGRVFEAYKSSFPLLDGHQQRVQLYQLYPLLVHVNLFGGGYAAQVERALQGLPG